MTAARAVSRGGRPSRARAQLLGDAILDVATELFLAQRYGATSIEAVARRAGISKRTFYARFPDKKALFSAVVHRIIRGLRPPEGTPLYDGGTAEEILRRLARLMLAAALQPMGLALSRLMMAEAPRFPELAQIASSEGTRNEAARAIAAILRRETEAGRMAVAKPDFAAEQFFQLVMSLPQRRAMGFGQPMTEAERDAWAEDSVTLFLNGCRHWAGDGALP